VYSSTKRPCRLSTHRVQRRKRPDGVEAAQVHGPALAHREFNLGLSMKVQ
jgi:hypothetical protein